MNKYKVVMNEHVHYEVEVYANSEEEASELAYEMDLEYDVTNKWSEMTGAEVTLVEECPIDKIREDFEEEMFRMVHNRYSEEGLIEHLRKITGIPNLDVDLDIGNECSTDYNAAFNIEGNHPLAGEHDLYYLKLREEGCDAIGTDLRIHVTGVFSKYY